jgi:hypothetical protein
VSKRHQEWLLDVDYLRRLRAGADRDGQMRSWREVAAIAQRSVGYVHQLCNGTQVPREVTVIDPRDIDPELKPFLDDDAVAAWQADPRCLCGCGVPSRREANSGAVVPRGAWRLYAQGHANRMPAARERHVARNREMSRRAAQSATQRSKALNSWFLSDMVDEYLTRTRQTSIDLAQRAHMAPSHVRAIRRGRSERVNPLTFGKLLAAMDEPMRPEIAAVYREWARTQQIDVSRIRVEK